MDKFTTYKDLVQEQKRLEAAMHTNRAALFNEWEIAKKNLKPFENTLEFVSNVTSKNHKNPLLNMGIDLGVDVLVKRMLLGKAGFLAKLLVPMVVRNYSSNVLSTNGTAGNLFSKIGSFFKRRKPNVVKVEQAGKEQ